MDKIYSRRRIKLPKFNCSYKNSKDPNYKKMMKVFKITCIMMIAVVTANVVMQAISPIINKQCINMAKAIATKISNEQATIVMANYEYDDLCNVTKDSSRKYSYD